MITHLIRHDIEKTNTLQNIGHFKDISFINLYKGNFNLWLNLNHKAH